MTIKTLTYRDDRGMDNTHTVGCNGVIEIIEHKSAGEGDKWYYDVVTENEITRIFNFIRTTISN